MIYALVGTNSFLVQQKLREIRSSFIKKHGRDGVETHAGENIDPDNLTSMLASVSLFASHRLIIIKHLSENKAAAERFMDLMKTIPHETTVLLVEGALDKRTAYYKALKKLNEFHELSELDEQTLAAWAQAMVEKEGAVIDQQAIRALLAATGGDQERLAHEIVKLAAYTKEITPETVALLVEESPQDNVFELLTAALGGKTQQALKILDQLERAHADPFQLVNMLIWQVHILSVVASAGEVSDQDIARGAKINPFVVSKTRTLARRLNQGQLQNIIDRTAQLDISLKTGTAEPWRLLEQIILSI